MTIEIEPVDQLPNAVHVTKAKNRLRRRSETWRWVFLSSNGFILARSSESYANLSDLLGSLAQVLGCSTELLDPESWQQTGFSLQRVSRHYGKPVTVVIRDR